MVIKTINQHNLHNYVHETLTKSKAPAVSLSKKLYSPCLVLVGSRNGFERDLHKQIIACFTIELKQMSIN